VNLVPLTLAAANDFVAAHHRHHRPVVGHRFSIGAQDGGVLVGAAIVGRPVARHLDDGFTAEVTRLVTDGTKNACSMLYAGLLAGMEGDGRASADHRVTSAVKPSSRCRATGWKVLYQTKERPKGWDTPSRRRASGEQVAKQLWEAQGD